jgi:hypothetical protein
MGQPLALLALSRSFYAGSFEWQSSRRNRLKVMEKGLRKTGESRYEVVVDGEVIGEVWSWHGSWSAQAEGKTYHGHKSRKEAAQRVERVHGLRGQL